jgi:hypothetical protein
MSSNDNEVVGITGDFFVVVDGVWIKTFDEDCRRIAQMSSHKVTVIGAAGDTFTTEEGPYIKSYDQNCKKTGQRVA